MMLTKPLWEIDFGGGDLGINCLQEQNFAQDFVQKTLGKNQMFDRHLKSLLKKMLASDPKQRPTIEDILRKKFIRQQQHLVKFNRLKESFKSNKKNKKASEKEKMTHLSEELED